MSTDVDAGLVEIESWLERRWMGRLLPTITDKGYNTLESIQSCSDTEAEAIIALFEKPGHRLKIRILLQDLRNKAIGNDGDIELLGGGAVGKESTESDEESAESDGGDDGDSGSDSEDENNSNSITTATTAESNSIDPASITAATQQRRSSLQLTGNGTAAELQQSQVIAKAAAAAAALTAAGAPPALDIESDDSDDEGGDIGPQARSPVNATLLAAAARAAEEELAAQAEADAESARIVAAERQQREEEARAAAEEEEKRAAAAAAAETDRQKRQPSTAAKSPPATSGALAGRIANMGLNNNSSTSPNSTSGTSSPTKAGAGLAVGSLKERMAKLAEAQSAQAAAAAASTSSVGGGNSASDAEQKARRSSAFKKKLAGAGALNIMAPGAPPPAFLASKMYQPSQPAAREFRDDSEDMGNHQSTEEFEYDLPPVANLIEPQKTGFLEKRASETEWKQRWCILKDDCLFWLRDTSEDRPAGIIVLSEPGVTMQLIDDLSLEINTRRKAYQFRSQSAEEMAGWNSKLRVAKLLYTSGTAVSFAKKVRVAERPQPVRSTPQVSASSPINKSPTIAEDYGDEFALAQSQLSKKSQSMMPAPPPSSSQKQAIKQPPPASNSGPVSSASRSAAASQSKSKPKSDGPDPTQLRDLLTRGGIFTKYKHKRGKRRLIWAPPGLDRIFWGDEKKKVKGYMMTTDIKGVSAGCTSAKIQSNAFTIVSTERTLDLEASNYEQGQLWISAVHMLIQLAQSR